MLSSFQARRAEEKLGAILDRVGAIRSRLNRLAWQTAVFGILAWLIGCAALVLLAAYFAPPLTFLVLFVVLLATMVAGLVWTGRIAWREHATTTHAAAVADERAGLKGRLRTIIELGWHQPGEAPRNQPAEAMWSYLIEDTLARRDQYEPRRIERRHLSRAFYGLLASMLIVALAAPLILGARKQARLAQTQNSEITFNPKDLRLRADNRASGQGLQLRADARTRKMLQDMMGMQGSARRRKSSSSLDRMLNHARNLAARLQDKLTGRSPANRGLKLKLADASRFRNPLDNRAPSFQPSPAVRPDGQAGKPRQSDRSSARSMPLPPFMKPQEQARGRVPSGKPQGEASGAKKGEGTKGKFDSDKSARSGTAKHEAGSGTSHGIGTDEANLFGKASGGPKPGTPGFEIAIQAEPAARGSKTGGETYVPPTVDTPLNPQQHRDEPIPRASIPEQDRAAIRSVFER